MPRRTKNQKPPTRGPARQKKNKLRQRVANDSTAANRQILAVGDRKVPLLFLQNRRARRIIIRLDQSAARIVVVLPSRATRDQGHRFALSNKGWIRDRLALLPKAVPFRHGAVVPYLGVEHRIRHRPGTRGAVWRENGEIHVAGRPEHLARRVEDWLKREARREIERRAQAKSEQIGKPIAGLTIRDAKSRWGSCSPSGKLSFSWRLILAPRAILDYVVAHEVAHLKELNHGPRFWRLTAELTRDVERARSWLNSHGPALHRYG